MNQSQIFLNKKYDEMRANNPHFSQRAFAMKAGLSSGAMSSILNGKRDLSKKIASKISQRLGLDNCEFDEFMSPFFKEDESERVVNFDHARLEMEQYRIISQWQHLALLNLLNCHDYRASYEWMAQRLGISESLVKDSMERLLEVGLLKKVNNSFKRTSVKLKTPDNIASRSLKAAHKQTLDLASKSLEEVDIDKRDFTAMTMAIDPSKMKYAKKRIREFLVGLSDELESGDQSEVYKMAVQLFPLTQVES